jgi:hypothetical protein
MGNLCNRPNPEPYPIPIHKPDPSPIGKPDITTPKKDFVIPNGFAPLEQFKNQNIKEKYHFQDTHIHDTHENIINNAFLESDSDVSRAIKIIPKSLKNPIELKMQIGITLNGSSPNIMKTYEAYEDSENYYIVMDYLEG